MHDDVHSQVAIAPFEPGPLAAAGGIDPYTTEFVRLGTDEGWAEPAPGTDIQVLVTEGTLVWESQELGPGSFVRLTWVEGQSLRSTAGCALLIKAGMGEPEGFETIAVDAKEAPWAPGQGKLRVLPLDSRDHESTALVHWPAGERFLPHRHFGGEEIFVLSGTFEDEHGSYPAGSWIQSPHGSVHHPYVVEETRIWVKTGHLPPPRQS